jgi:ribosomal protein S18 acetylase RimI-like enzyme
MFGAGNVDTQIEHTLYRTQHGAAPLFWALRPSLRGRELDGALRRHGLEPVEEVWDMAVPLAEAPEAAPLPPALSIERVGTHAELVQWVQILTHGDQGEPDHDKAVLQWIDLEARLGLSEWSPWQRYLGYWEGKPVATAGLFCAAESAGIYHVATLPEARGRGIGTALTSALMAEGRARGYEVAVLIATDMGIPIYRRLGFQSYQPLSIYMLHSQN